MTAKRPTLARQRTRTRPRSLRVARPLGVLLLAGVAFLLPGSALAADDEDEKNWYVEFQGGIAITPNQTIQDGGTNMGSVEPHTDARRLGYTIGGAIGRRIADVFRAELAVNYREHGLDEASFGTVSNADVDGELGLVTFMLNGYVDFGPELIGLDLPVVPYVGGGFGYGEYRVDFRQKTANTLDVRGQEDVFAYNAMAGVRARITDVVGVSANYRYVRTTDAEGVRARIATVSQDIEAEFDAHEFFLGLNFSF